MVPGTASIVDKKLSFFSAMWVQAWEVALRLSPVRARHLGVGGGELLAPIMEGPNPEEADGGNHAGRSRWIRLLRGLLPRSRSSCSCDATRGDDLCMLLDAMCAAFAPVRVCATEPLPQLSIKVKDIPVGISSAEYILQQYLAASGGQKHLSSVRNAFALGTVHVVATMHSEIAGRVVKNHKAESCTEPGHGQFMLWQMAPEMWWIHLAAGGGKVQVGCNGEHVRGRTPWLRAHSANGHVRPLCLSLQGLDPLTTASMFAGACNFTKGKVNEDDCFILTVCAEPEAPSSMDDAITRIKLIGSFSQKTGLLVGLEYIHVTGVQFTTIKSFVEEYQPVDGIMIAHSGRLTGTRRTMHGASHTVLHVEEKWSIKDVEFNVRGVCKDQFILST